MNGDDLGRMPDRFFPNINEDAIEKLFVTDEERAKPITDAIKEMQVKMEELSKKNWVERNPVTFAVLIAILSATLGIGATLITQLISQ